MAVKNYKVIENKYVNEIDADVTIYEHEKTKAKVLVMKNDDPHKSFGIGFRTTPTDSTGVAHIIEHSVLCGSKKYPLKDPFVELAKGSLNTYLNAMTYADKTLYPISSENDKDFHNLMDVYLDAVFFPNIYNDDKIMRQEGWRYHLESEDTPIEYKGVVYNEMKGAFSSPEDIGFRMIKETLFPDNTYGNESGGAPAHIPDLTYENFIAFHKKYYHPSNSLISLYGNINVEETLEYIDSEYLSKFDYLKVDSEIPDQKPFDKEVERKEFYSASEDGDQGLFLSYNFVVDKTVNREKMLAMEILTYVLLDTPASPLRKALIAEEIGDDVYGAFQTHLKQPIFSIIAKNVKPEKRDRFYEVINEVLNDLVKNGLPQNLLKGALQIKEFDLRESDASGYSKGLFYLIAATKAWVYDASPLVSLEYEEALAAVKSQLGTSYFEDLIKKYLIDNNHSARVELYPKVGLEKEIEDKVTERLAKYKASLTPEQIKQLVKDTKEFEEYQMTPDSQEAIESIPLLKREDLRRESSYPRFKTKVVNDVDYTVSPIFTNKIAYLAWNAKLDNISEEYIPYLGLIVGLLGKVNTKNYTYEELSAYMDEHIGGMSFQIQALNKPSAENGFLPIFSVTSKALVSELKEQVELMYEVFVTTVFDDKNRILEVLREIKGMMASAISSDGNRISMGRLMSHLTAGQYFEEKAKGLAFYEFVCDLEKNWDAKQDEAVAKIKEAYHMMHNQNRISVGITVDSDLEEEVTKANADVIARLGKEDITPIKLNFQITNEQEALVYPSNVNYVAMGYNFKELGFKYNGGLNMLRTMLSMNYLWNKVRVQNGAYGCSCDFRKSGNMFFVSYRDPNITKTLDTYREVVEFVENLNLSDRELQQYLIGTISSLDFPYTAVSEGRSGQLYALMNVSKEEIQKTRDELFATTNETLRGFAPMLKACLEKNQYCVFGNAGNIEASGVEFETTTNI